MAKLSVLTWVGNAAAGLCGRRGAVSDQARQARCSRQTVYDHTAKVQQALAVYDPGHSRDALLQEVEQLRAENRQLWGWLEDSFACPKPKRRQFAATAAAMGLSLQQTLTLLAILLPARLLPSRPTLGRWVQHSARRAGRLLRVLDAACRRLVLCLCLDEIFFRRQPVLMGIEPYSLAWVLGRRAADHSGPAWSQALAAWPAVTDVAADGGSGLELGIDLARRARQEAAAQRRAEAVPLHVRLDLFHTRREGERALRRAWAAAEARWAAAEKVDRAKARFDRGGGDGRHFKKDVAGKADSTPIVVFAHVPLWTVYEKWGWGTEDSAQALDLLKRFGSVTVLNGHVHQILQKVEGKVTFHTARSTAFPQPEPGKAESPGPIKNVAADKLRGVLGVSQVSYVENKKSLATVDATLE